MSWSPQPDSRASARSRPLPASQGSRWSGPTYSPHPVLIMAPTSTNLPKPQTDLQVYSSLPGPLPRPPHSSSSPPVYPQAMPQLGLPSLSLGPLPSFHLGRPTPIQASSSNLSSRLGNTAKTQSPPCHSPA